MISNGAIAASLSGISDYFYRTVPPDTVQGAVLADTIVQDGVQKLAIACFNDEAGDGIRDVVVEHLQSAGVEVVYGEKDSFDPTEKNFSSFASFNELPIYSNCPRIGRTRVARSWPAAVSLTWRPARSNNTVPVSCSKALSC